MIHSFFIWQKCWLYIRSTLQTVQQQQKKDRVALYGVLMVLLSAVLFSGKAVLAKLVYRQSSMSVSELLVLRMLFSLPFYVAMLLMQWQKHKRNATHQSFMQRSHVLPTILLGLLGYYISSFFDFWGLKHISAGLERVILFSYPTMVVLFGAWFFKEKIQRHQVLALLLSYAGIGVAFAADFDQPQTGNVWIGAAFIVGCAITFSLYVLFSGKLVPQVGVSKFTAVAMLSATTAIFLHYFVMGGAVQQLLSFSPQVYGYMLLMAVFTTVVPSLLVSAGLKRVGSSNVAIISSVGPIVTIFQAWYFLGEPFGWQQAIGTVLVVAGVLWVSKKTTQQTKAA